MVSTVLHLLLYIMASKSKFILDNKHLFDLHPATFLILDALRAPAIGYKVAKSAVPVNGMWFRKEVVNVADMATASQFFNPRQKGMRDSREMIIESLTPHVSIEDTHAYASSIDKRVIFFIEMFGTIDLLPFHPSQRIYFKVNPRGCDSKQSTATYYQTLRCGFVERFTSYRLHKENTVEQLETAYGYIEGVAGHDALVRMFIPQSKLLETVPNLIDSVPFLREWESEGEKGIHLPAPEELAPYFVGM